MSVVFKQQKNNIGNIIERKTSKRPSLRYSEAITIESGDSGSIRKQGID